jgi:4-hydroxy-tetrahydrodipicolinate reductase
MKVLFTGSAGRVGAVVVPALEAAGHAVTRVGRGDGLQPAGHDVAVDFTRPDVGAANVRTCLEQDVPVILGTSGVSPAELEALGGLARSRGLQLLVVPNFAVGAVLMMRLAAEAARFLPDAEIVELHHATKLDAPSATARATAELLPGDPPIHSVRLPGLVAHQEVLLGGQGQVLTIRHDATSREAYIPGVLLALERLATLPPGLTVGLDAVLD